MIKRIIWLSVLLFAVPLFGFIVAEGLQDSVRTEFAAALAGSSDPSTLSIRSGTPCPKVSLNQFLSRPCITYGQVQILRDASIGIAVLAFLMLAAIWGAAAFARGSRERLILLFVPGVYCVIVLLFCIIIGQAAVLTFATFLVGFDSTGEISFRGMQFALPAAAGGVAAAYGMVVAAVRALKPEPNSELAIELTRDEQPRLWRFVRFAAFDASAWCSGVCLRNRPRAWSF